MSHPGGVVIPKRGVGSIDHELFPGFKFNYSEVTTWVKNNGFSSLAIQLPSGLIRGAVKLITKLESELNISVFLFADPCYGACDQVGNKLGALGIDGIVHFGHAEIPNCLADAIPVKYIVLESTVDPVRLLKKEEKLKTLKSELKTSTSIGLLANIQFVNYLSGIKTLLESLGFKVHVGTGDKRIRAKGNSAYRI